MGIVVLIIVGIAAGFLATRFMWLETDVLTTFAIGVAGALIGGFVLRGLIVMASGMAGFVGAVLGAMLLIWIWKTYARQGMAFNISARRNAFPPAPSHI